MAGEPDRRDGHAAPALFAAVQAFLSTCLPAEWRDVLAAMSRAPTPARRPAARSLPVLRWLPAAAPQGSAQAHALISCLAAAAPRLAWAQTYDADDFGAGFLERYGWTELLGRRGPYHSESLACGFLLLGPEIEYPRHRHAAEELYVILAGHAAWLQGDGGFTLRAPGSLVHHPPWCPHAMRTGQEALLALYLWRGGDLTQKSEIA